MSTTEHQSHRELEQEPAYQVGAQLWKLRQLLADQPEALDAVTALEDAYEAMLEDTRRRLLPQAAPTPATAGRPSR